MMKERILIFATALLLLCAPMIGAERHAARGLVLQIDRARNQVTISCEKIPDYMDAMVMPFAVRDARELNGIQPGTMIQFTVVVDGENAYIEGIEIHRYEGAEQDPASARRLKLMAGIERGQTANPELKLGEQVPDFALTDQLQRTVRLSQFRGKVVALTFMYTHCALPNFCFKISNNFRQVQQKLASSMGRDLILLSVTFDPVHDTPAVLTQYAKTWHADPESWRVLTGDSDAIAALGTRFGMSYWADEGLMNHSLRTAVIGRDGRLIANLEGNEYTAAELEDLLHVQIDAQRSASAKGRGNK